MEDFYDLMLNVKGLKITGDSPDDYLSLEELHGDIQYFCKSCRALVDAAWSIKLWSLGEILNFQFRHCVFLPKQFQRDEEVYKKIFLRGGESAPMRRKKDSGYQLLLPDR